MKAPQSFYLLVKLLICLFIAFVVSAAVLNSERSEMVMDELGQAIWGQAILL